jgi:hypothetical protein
MGTNFSSKTMMGNTMVIDSTIMTTCMLLFSNPFLNFDSMPKKLTLTNMVFCKYYSCISIWSDLILKVIVVRATNHNANMHNLDFPCFYLQVDQKCQTHWNIFASNATSLTLKSKSSTATTNQTSFTKIIAIVQERR